MTQLDNQALLPVLESHEVHFVVIGGIAADIHDLPLPATVDLDITPTRDEENLHALAAALNIVFIPDGAVRGFPDLIEDAIKIPVGRTEPLVVSIMTWVHLKVSSGRAKDLAHLDMYFESRKNL